MLASRTLLTFSAALIAGLVAGPVTVPTVAAAGTMSQQVAQQADRQMVTAPPGFRQSCERYQWFCDERPAGAEPESPAAMLDLATVVNQMVNQSVTPLTDVENYGAMDYWTLPTNGNGDCEDYVLQKYKLLVEAGVASRDLSVAIVLDRNGDNHAVLVLRHASGDLVLDSLVRRIRPWNETGYKFLAMQTGDNKSQWEVVMNQTRDSLVLAQR